MKTTSEKAKRRLESKKRKVSAFLQVAELNDSEKRRKILQGSQELDQDAEEYHDQTKAKAAQGPKGPLLSGDSYQELKDRLRERKKLLMQLPDFDLKTVGHNASVDMHEDFKAPLFIKDLQHLLLYALMGTKAPVEPSRWCKFTKWSKLTGIVVLVIEGAGLNDFYDNRDDKFSNLAQFLRFKLEFISPASYDSRIARDFSLLPISQHQKEKLKKKYGGLERAIEQGSAYRVLKSIFPIMKKKVETEEPVAEETENLKIKLLLSVSQMIEEGFPVPLDGQLREKYKHFVMTKSEYTEVTEDSPLFSVDCEMCITSSGMSELTRICLINSNMEVVYASFVKPKNHITNYLTRFSGITSELLENVTTSVADVQKALIDILPSDAILIGHSLNSDLCAMQMMHPYVIDTSVIYCVKGARSRKSKLSVLSSMFLGEKIQQDRPDAHLGHNPKEDAEAAMKLVLLKLEKGYSFGDCLLDGTIPDLDSTKELSKEILASTLFNQAKDNNQSVCIVGETSILEQYQGFASGAKAESIEKPDEKKSAESSSSPEHAPDQSESEDQHVKGVVFAETSSVKETVSKACELSFNHNLTICHVDISHLVDDAPASPAQEQTEKKPPRLNRKGIKNVSKWTKKMWSHTSQNGLFVTVWPGTSDQNAFVGIALNKATIVM